MPMMGRGSDTRMYSPRSESSHMYGSANEDGGKYSPTSPEDADKRREEKQRKDEERKARLKDIKHIKIKPSQGLGSGPKLPTEEGLDDGNKRDDEREISLQGGPAGSRGHLLDLATGAKTGTGSAMGTGNSAVRTGEPMKDAWSTLLKEEDDVPDMSNFRSPYDPNTRIPDLSMDDLYRLLEHPNERIAHKANEEMKMRSMDAEGSNLPFDETTSAGEVAAFYEPQFKNLKYGNQQPPSFDEGVYNEEGYDEAYSQERAGDVLEAMPGDIEFFPSLADKYEHLKNTAPPEVVENYLNRIKDFFDEYTQPGEIFGTTLPPLYTPELPKGTLYTPEEIMQQSDKINEAFNVYPSGHKSYTGFTDKFQNKLASEPMDDAWSELLKRDTPKKIQARRRREARQEFRPSTGQFKKPPGGQSGGAGATMRRFKARMRGIKGGKRTGLMKPHLSVEMSHRGIATKQPMSKDPQKYRQYMGQQEAQKILGGVRNTFSPHARHSARSFIAGPTGGGRLTGMLPGQAGQMRQPSLTRLGRPRRPRMPRMPRMPRPPMPPQMPMMPPSPPMPIMTSEDTPSQIMMSSDRTESEILKANRHARRLEMLELMRRLIDLQKKRNKLMKYVQGGGSAFENGHVPTHPAGVQQHEDEDEKNDGPTQNLETNSSRLGLDPAGHLSGKRGHFG